MPRRFAFRLVAAFLFAPALSAAAPYTVPDTEVLKLHSKATGADYELFVAAPAAPAPGKTYPTIYMLDADYSFAIARNVVQHFVERQNLPPMILVAIAYPGAAHDRDIYHLGRTRDYTPSFVPSGGYGPQFQKHSGGASKFRDFIAAELVPFIEKRFPADKADRTIVGHSFGGLFASYVLETKPDLFKRYIIVSPSLWYDNQMLFRLDAEQAKANPKLDAHVFLSVGALENEGMADDLRTYANKLAKRGQPGLHINSQVFENETHNSVFPGAFTRGVLQVFDAFPATAPPADTGPAPRP